MITFGQIIYLVPLIALTASILYYAMVLRNQNKTQKLQLETRQADYLLRQTQVITDDNHQKSWYNVVWEQKFSTQEEWLEKYSYSVNPEAYTNLLKIIQYYNHLGILIMDEMIPAKLIIETVTPIIIILPWKRIEPLVERWRTIYQDDTLMEGYEYLINIIRERHPKLVEVATVPYD